MNFSSLTFNSYEFVFVFLPVAGYAAADPDDPSHLARMGAHESIIQTHWLGKPHQ